MRCGDGGRVIFSAVHDLFDEQEDVDLAKIDSAAPLATRMRPRTLEEFARKEQTGRAKTHLV